MKKKPSVKTTAKLSVKTPAIKPLFKLLVITLLPLLLGSALTGCSSNPSAPNYSLDRIRLGRSAIFTQRELINEQLKDPAAIDSVKKATLLNSYCDLIGQSAIYVTRENIPEECNSLNNLQRKCAYNFHLCVNTCSLRSNECLPCIEQARECLDSE